MSDILKSASKIVLILLVLALVIGLFVGKITEDTFKVCVLMVLTYYFTVKSGTTDVTSGIK